MAQRPAFDPFDNTEEALEADILYSEAMRAHRDHFVEIHQITILWGRQYGFMTFDATARNGETGLVLCRAMAPRLDLNSCKFDSSSTRYMSSREGVKFVIQEGSQVGERGPPPLCCRSTPEPSDATLVARFHASHELQLFSSVGYFSAGKVMDDVEWANGVINLIKRKTSLDPYQAPGEEVPVLLEKVPVEFQ